MGIRVSHCIVQQEYSNWDISCALTSYQNNGGFGGSGGSIAIPQGWNVIGAPTTGVSNVAQLVTDMTRAGQLPAGSITKVGDRMVRTALYEAASVMLTRTVGFSGLKAWAMAVAKRRGMKKARVALTRKLDVVLRQEHRAGEKMVDAI